MTFAISSLPVMLWQLTWRPQVVITIAPAQMCAPTAWLVARLCGAKAWLHIQDFEVDVAFQMGLLKGRRTQDWLLGLEGWLLRQFDVVSSISGAMVQRLLQKGVDPTNAYLFPNWVDLTQIVPLNVPSTYRAELGIGPGVKVVLFSGTLSNKQGLMVIPEAARLMSHRKDIVFVVCGDGAMKPQLEEAAQQLPNLLMLPLQPLKRLSELLGLADMHLLPQSLEAEDLVLPSKLTGMLASGRPVIATCRAGTEIATVVGQCGLIVPPGDAAALVESIEQLDQNETLRLCLGKQARLYAEQYLEREAVLGAMMKRLVSLID
jgi:colanic acid biosynthesis glycosyl transferase WcaI